MVATMPLGLIGPRSVMIFQWPPGVALWIRWPPRQRPRNRVIENVGLRLNQSEHVHFDRFAQAARNAIARLWAAHRAVVFSSLMLVAFRPTAGEAAGIREVVIPANANQPRIVAELWTPCSTPAPEGLLQSFGDRVKMS